MDFYEAISRYYRDIFPLNPMQVAFVKKSFSKAGEKSLLDVGCGKGDLVLELGASFKHLTGIDLDRAMLEEARDSSSENTRFMELDMMHQGNKFGEAAFNGILCFGNTLVHLPDLASISDFLHQCRKALNEDGKLLLQLINYDRILDQDVKYLPTIKTEACSFIRNYHYDSSIHRVNFETILQLKSSGEIIHNNIRLYPLRQAELHKILLEAGFSSISYFGNFRRDLAKGDSIPLVVEACV